MNGRSYLCLENIYKSGERKYKFARYAVAIAYI